MPNHNLQKCIQCDPCNILSGFDLAGLYFDGKLNSKFCSRRMKITFSLVDIRNKQMTITRFYDYCLFFFPAIIQIIAQIKMTGATP